MYIRQRLIIFGLKMIFNYGQKIEIYIYIYIYLLSEKVNKYQFNYETFKI